MAKEFNLDNYEIIDYSTFKYKDESKKGANIRDKLLQFPNGQKYLDIWNESYNFRGQRRDPEQEEQVTRFAMELLKYEEGNPDVVIPAAMLHDTGFYFEKDKNAWKANVNAGGATEGEAKRRPHQNRGILLATQILTKTGYPEEYLCEIADIIGDHDTRLLSTTPSGVLMREADYLWRITYTDMRHYFTDKSIRWNFDRMTGGLVHEDGDKKGQPIESICLYNKAPFNLREAATGIGRVELINSLYVRAMQTYPMEEQQKSLDDFDAIPGYKEEKFHVAQSYAGKIEALIAKNRPPSIESYLKDD
ncbi:MAG TPA: hypothetical protein VEC16_03655 [Alphaproteobacteria bacterium]|nr:hypothetical protein [Alphaproteobacteria bacterium]